MRNWSDLNLWQRRALKTVVGVTVLIVASSVVYHYVQIAFEGEDPAYHHSLQVVIETYTGTGYGSDAGWDHPVANFFVSLMDLSTFLVLFIVVPYVFRPVLEEALSPSVPTAVDLSDHVVVCGVDQQGDRLVEELEARGVDYVIVAESEETTLSLQGDDVSAIHGDPTSPEALERACVGRARSVVVDTDDMRSASAVIAVREVDEAIRTVVLVEDLEYERHLQYAGADRVLTPRHLLGRRIAERISAERNPARSDSTPIGEDFSLLELTVDRGTDICGETVEAIESTADAAVSVVGVWTDGSFVTSPDPTARVDEDAVLLLAGRASALRDLESAVASQRDLEPRVIVAGYGIVGSTVERTLAGSALECTVVDLEDRPGVDVVGDATDEETLREAGIDAASILVVAIADDDQAVLTTVVADELAAGTDVIVRVNRPENASKVRRAGADYVLSLPEITGRILAREVLEEEVLSYNRQLKLVRIDAATVGTGPLSRTTIAETDCAVVAVEREGDLVTDVSGSFEIRAGDRLLVAGSDEEIDALEA